MKKHERVVISLHGIRTRGVWQKDLVPSLARAGFIPYVLDYGDFGALKLINPSSLDAKVEWLGAEYARIKSETGCERPSIIAHSFGTLQAARLLQKHEHIVFDTMILAAAIVPTDFPWSRMLDQKRVYWVENYYGGKDLWPRVAERVVPHAGASGSISFSNRHGALYQVFNRLHGHSDYFSAGNFRDRWIPTLLLDKRRIVDAMTSTLHHLAATLAVDFGRLRSFVWARSPGTEHLEVVRGLAIGEIAKNEDKAVISLDDPFGRRNGPALAFRQRRFSLQLRPAVLSMIQGAAPTTPVHPDLQWTVALPLPDGSESAGISGVLVFDGLVMPPGGVALGAFEGRDIIRLLLHIGRLLHGGRASLEERS